MSKNYREAYAIIRVDEWMEDPKPGEYEGYGTMNKWNHKVTIKKVVFDQQFAISEVDRLNELNGDKECVYLWQYCRVEE